MHLIDVEILIQTISYYEKLIMIYPIYEQQIQKMELMLNNEASIFIYYVQKSTLNDA